MVASIQEEASIVTACMVLFVLNLSLVHAIHAAEKTEKAIYLLLPAPQEIVYSTELCKLAEVQTRCRIDPRAVEEEEGYRIEIKPECVEVVAAGAAAKFYAQQTLRQLALQADCNGHVRCLEIKDYPDFPVRGVMLDISRDKVPTMDTLYQLVDMLASWKINQFQLYTEHTFAYQGHETVWDYASPMTASQVRELDAYCKERFVDLVPNQNSFGHMRRWLSHEKYRHLAEAPEFVKTSVGMRRWNTICPTDPRSIELISELYDDLLPNFSSPYFNIGCDETFELGLGRSKEACDALGRGQVYLDFLTQLNVQAKKHDKTVMFWADIILSFPELVDQVPEDAIALAWGYEPSQPTAEVCQALRNSRRQYYVCPGVATWITGAGRTDHALANIANAAKMGLKHGASGLLNTDWGDAGSWEPITTSYPGYAYGAAVSWANRANQTINIPAALDLLVFDEKNGVIGKLIYDLGNAYKSSGIKVHNSSFMIRILIDPDWDLDRYHVTVAKIRQTEAYIDTVMARLDSTQIGSADADIVKAELTHAASILRLGCHLGIARLEADDHKIINIPERTRRKLVSEMERVAQQHKKVWRYRNRPGGLGHSVALINTTLGQLTGNETGN